MANPDQLVVRVSQQLLDAVIALIGQVPPDHETALRLREVNCGEIGKVFSGEVAAFVVSCGERSGLPSGPCQNVVVVPSWNSHRSVVDSSPSYRESLFPTVARHLDPIFRTEFEKMRACPIRDARGSVTGNSASPGTLRGRRSRLISLVV